VGRLSSGGCCGGGLQFACGAARSCCSLPAAMLCVRMPSLSPTAVEAEEITLEVRGGVQGAHICAGPHRRGSEDGGAGGREAGIAIVIRGSFFS
jgi:hypothetical protein